MEQNTDFIEINIKELLHLLLQNIGKIMLSAVLLAAITFSYNKLMVVPQYTSTVKLYALTKTEAVISISDIQTGTNLTKDYEIIISSSPVVEEVIDNLSLNMTYEQMCNKLHVSSQANTRIINITVTDSNPEMAKIIVDEFANVVSEFIADKLDQEAPVIIENGLISDKNVGSNTLKNTIAGGLIGGTIVIIVLVVNFLMNDTIMSSEDIEKYLGMNTLASFPKEEEIVRKKSNVKTGKKQKKGKRVS